MRSLVTPRSQMYGCPISVVTCLCVADITIRNFRVVVKELRKEGAKAFI